MNPNDEVYIKMCEKSVEIQILAPLEFGNWYAYLRPVEGKRWYHPYAKEYPYGRDREYFLRHPIKPEVNLIVEDYAGNPCHIYTDDIERCWLPSQDQLQEIAHGQPYDYVVFYWTTFQHFILFTANAEGYTGWTNNQTSMEQLWLAFVMKEKYNKVWNGEDWITES